MKALTLWQPWASLVALSEKKVETRVWETRYRGPLAIHAAARIPPAWLGASRQFPEFQTELADVFCVRKRDLAAKVDVMLPRGAVLCIVRLVGIERAECAVGILCQRELIFGNYEEGR
jgi:hypothetical protein